VGYICQKLNTIIFTINYIWYSDIWIITIDWWRLIGKKEKLNVLNRLVNQNKRSATSSKLGSLKFSIYLINHKINKDLENIILIPKWSWDTLMIASSPQSLWTKKIKSNKQWVKTHSINKSQDIYYLLLSSLYDMMINFKNYKREVWKNGPNMKIFDWNWNFALDFCSNLLFLYLILL